MITQEEKPEDTPEREANSEPGTNDSAKIEGLENQVKQLQDQLLRSMAETENVRNRAAKEIEDSRKYAVTSFAKDLTDVLENLYRSTDFLTEEQLKDDDIYKIFSGIKMTQDEFVKILERQGLKRIAPKVGEKFDHNYHQAVSTVKAPDLEENSIVTVIQAGYVLHGRLVKPTMVVVSTKSQS